MISWFLDEKGHFGAVKISDCKDRGEDGGLYDSPNPTPHVIVPEFKDSIHDYT